MKKLITVNTANITTFFFCVLDSSAKTMYGAFDEIDIVNRLRSNYTIVLLCNLFKQS